jgi:BirA family transcriptional regulator, biotin operon repressor / biotin---[acetyl-CoA-carboxylase] ligase
MPNDVAKWTLPTSHLGRCVEVFDCLDSTNSLALSLAHDPTQHGVVFLAREQTAGRGQYGRSWLAPPERSVLLSVLLFPPAHLRQPALLTAWAAVSVCETIRALANLQAKIKWPNDVLLGGKKVCGILIEQRTTGHADFPLATVAGIGLNVAQTAEMFAQANLPDAASLASITGQTFAYETVAKDLIRQLDQQYHLLHDGDLHTLESLWKGRLGLLGENVIAEGVNETQRGRLFDVTFAGIDIQVDGSVVRVAPESVRQLRTEY